MSRRDIYYWKCDRPAAFHGTQTRGEADAEIEQQLGEALRRHFVTQVVELHTGIGQGNHLTWNARVAGQPMFIRVENGPEKDGQLAVESALLGRVSEAGVITPRVYACDATRSRVPFAWQALEHISAPDLNHWFKQGRLDVPRIAFDIGSAVAQWQQITLPGFGILDESMKGYHATYADYFHLRLDQHLAFLVTRSFLTQPQSDEILAEIENHRSLLQLDSGCFVHKDLALWNILGSESKIDAFIDFDDAISGDPMDDLSLLACFHDDAFLRRAFEGYQSTLTFPSEHLRRFWLHLLRNMIVKAVIRVGAGYFDRDDGFFLISSGTSGQSLRDFTLKKLFHALHCLRSNAPM
ncbi:MAG: aminoglycoside phosphotransferase family protein [Prosthecobacter sp.]|uniref:phosphotransferase family protein n=1 Tax=Prosthecobacter sp. TaxID=1965333 RepID=UPI0025D3CA23|nr:aminoglycoside phosphotransferase family protein [Prosthecobacter sp.]MCF7784473.1 aminoglycoside phosphotransferase family protein [Prosthecobacter sp.]